MHQVTKKWLERDPDPTTRAELESLVAEGQEAELGLRFSGRLEFGTAGLRGVLGAGPNRMNRLVIRETSAGLGAYLKTAIPEAEKRGVVVGYDGRILSKEFADDTARVLASLGFKVFLSEFVVPTPVVAYAVKHFGAAAGVMVTASHNPPEYNGYKVYWENGAQIIEPHDKGIAACIQEAAQEPIPFAFGAEVDARIELYGDALEAVYMAKVAELSFLPSTPTRKSLVVAYTPMHGVGSKLVERALAQSGFEHVHVVAEQREPDGTFPTVRFPNPEEPGAMDLVTALAAKHNALLALASDPDADRLAVAARRADGTYQMLRGDQIGVLFGYEVLKRQPEKAVAASLVSSQLLGVMARAYGSPYYETLTGFKWIANAAMAHPETPFGFGYEEALGYTIGELVRDKDGISAAMIFCEMVASWQDEGRTVLDQIEKIDREFGIYLTAQRSISYSPENIALKKLNTSIREDLPWNLAGRKVESITDIKEGCRTFSDGTKEAIDLPQSDVLTFWLEGGARIIVRPSGTEPKIKCYYEVAQSVEEDYARAQELAATQLNELIQAHQRELDALI